MFWLKRALALLFLLCLTGSGTAIAAETDFYTINGNDKFPMPETYVYSGSINSLRGVPDNQSVYFSQPSDMAMDADGNLYVADTGNNRVVKINPKGELIQAYIQAGGTALDQPQGVYAHKNGDVYIADTGNSRVLRLTADGKLIQEHKKPDSPLLQDVDVYSPRKLAVSNTGGLYILRGETIMDVDSSNRLRGFLGQTDLGFDLMESILRVIASDEQKRNMDRRLADMYDNFCVDSQGLIYAVSRDVNEGQIKVLNTVGNNIYRKISTVENGSNLVNKTVNKFFSGNVLNKPFQYGESASGKSAIFTDICVDSQGIISVIQQQNGRIYQYDQSGRLLCVFGGTGTNKGEFAIPSSLTVDKNGNIFVLDSSYGNIQIFKPTNFILLVQQAVTLNYNGDYDDAVDLWNDILDMNDIYPLAYHGIANADYKNERWQEAMEGYRVSNDRIEYSKAFSEYRYLFLKTNFLWVTIVLAALAAIVYIIIIRTYRHSLKALSGFEQADSPHLSFKTGFLMSVGILYRPARTFECLKNARKRIRVSGVWLILLAMVIMRVCFIYTVHYPLQDIEPEDVNLLLEVVKQVLPVLSWTFAVYLISSQFDGESTLKENFIAIGYCMVPYVVVNTVAMLLSHILCWQEKGFFALLVNGVMIWTVWLLFRAVSILNNFTTMHTVMVCAFTVIAVVLCWFIMLFGYALFERFIQFIQEVVFEIQLVIYD